MKTFVCILFVLFSCVVEAHEDPSGEVYPYVCVEKDRFVVYYKVNNPSGGPAEFLQVAYDKNGKRVAIPEKVPKERLHIYRLWNHSDIDVGQREKLRGFALKSKEDFLITPAPPSARNKPYFLSKRNGEYNKEEIDWGNKEAFLIGDALLADDEVISLVSDFEPTGFLSNTVELLSINRKKRKVQNSLSVGVPARIRWSLTSSSLLHYGGRVFVAWGERYIDGLRLNVSSWKPTDAYLLKELVSGPVNWNTYISMAQIDGIALVAYHYAEDGYHNSVIKTLTVDLNKHLK